MQTRGKRCGCSNLNVPQEKEEEEIVSLSKYFAFLCAKFKWFIGAFTLKLQVQVLSILTFMQSLDKPNV